MDATLLVELAKEVNISQLLCTGLMIWFFYSRLDRKIEKLDEKFTLKIDKIDTKVNEIDRRVFGIETMLHMKECCMLKDDWKTKKVE